MDAVRLIDAVVRNTTTFIAQLSTAAGLRAPLAHIADQVFLELARDIEAQGVSRKVVAGMFGMALRGYQRKVQRLTESSSLRGKTLWEAVVEHLHQQGPSLRTALSKRFEADGEEHVAAVLRDLSDSGLVYCTGRGNAAVYGLSTEQDRQRVLLETRGEKLKAAIWYAVYRNTQTFGELCKELGTSESDARPIVQELLDEGLVSTDVVSWSTQSELQSRRFLVPVDAEHGWEVAVFDHYRAVLDAIAAKLRLRTQDPEAAKAVGGATLVFDVDVQHPMRDEVLGLLERVRGEVNELWNRVSAYNQDHPLDERELLAVTFYFGQNAQLSSERKEHE
jgi:hypothetical protein